MATPEATVGLPPELLNLVNSLIRLFFAVKELPMKKTFLGAMQTLDLHCRPASQQAF